jgi:hypothetical protein
VRARHHVGRLLNLALALAVALTLALTLAPALASTLAPTLALTLTLPPALTLRWHLINRPDNKLTHGAAYHWDTLVIGDAALA